MASGAVRNHNPELMIKAFEFVGLGEEDVKAKSYSGKDLKLIKSRLKFRDSFKMGASSLKHKKGKLFFTILLSSIAFAS